MKFFNLLKPFIYSLPPETAHNLAISALSRNLILKPRQFSDSILESTIAGIRFKNPVGLAAGFDKNAKAINNLQKFNFGFIEAGTVTPRAQPGNPKPRLFRLTNEKAIINQMGFNNLGKENFRQNYLKNNKIPNTPIGINIGKNKTTQSNVSDYIELLKCFYDIADYLTINISSPNTPNLRNIQKKGLLEELLSSIHKETKILTANLKKNTPIFLKISPDISQNELQDICDLSLKYKIDALIISNTTISRPHNITSNTSGGLSGAPLLSLSNHILKEIYKYTKGKIPLIGVGGISNAKQAYAKICLGASLIQIYSAFIFQGFNLTTEINKELATLLRNDGFNNIKEAIGCKIK